MSFTQKLQRHCIYLVNSDTYPHLDSQHKGGVNWIQINFSLLNLPTCERWTPLQGHCTTTRLNFEAGCNVFCLQCQFIDV